MGWAFRGIRLGVSDFLQIALQSPGPLGVCYGFAVVFILIFRLPQFWGRGACRGR